MFAHQEKNPSGMITPQINPVYPWMRGMDGWLNLLDHALHVHTRTSAAVPVSTHPLGIICPACPVPGEGPSLAGWMDGS